MTSDIVHEFLFLIRRGPPIFTFYWSSFVCSSAYLVLFFFFFSSRRRHTRFDCDWSSDVCSSDLAFYTWLLSRTSVSGQLRADWSGFLLAQMVFGLMWSGLFTGLEAASGRFHLQAGWPLLGALLFIAVGPAILAYRFWGLGVQRSSPAVAGFRSEERRVGKECRSRWS